MSCDLASGRLLNECNVGRAGIKTLYFTKFADYEALTGITEIGGEITSLGSDPIFIYQFDLGDNVGNFEQVVEGASGAGVISVVQTVTMTLFQIKPEDLDTLNNLKKGRWVIWTRDFNDKIRLFGETRGMVATGGSDVSGAGPGDKMGLDLVLTGVCDEYAPFMADYTSNPFDNFANVLVVSTYIAEYQIVYDAFTSKPDSTVAAYQNAMVAALVAAGVWTKLDVLYILAGHTNGAGESLINWITPGTYNATLGGTPNPAFVAFEGFTGDGANGYIDTGFKPNDGPNYTVNSASFGVYSRTDSGVQGAAEMGSYNSSTTEAYLVLRSAGNALFGMINSGNASSIAITDTLGFNAIRRLDASFCEVFKNGVLDTPTASIPDAVGNVNFYICAYALGTGPTPSAFSPRQLSLAFAGAGLTEDELNAFMNAFEAYMDSNGKGVIP